MGLIIKNGIRYFGDNSVELTQAQYDALSQEEKLNGTTYYITDGQNITTASAVSYNNTASGLTATNVQGAIDEVDEKTGSDIAVSDSSSETIAEAINSFRQSGSATIASPRLTIVSQSGSYYRIGDFMTAKITVVFGTDGQNLDIYLNGISLDGKIFRSPKALGFMGVDSDIYELEALNNENMWAYKNGTRIKANTLNGKTGYITIHATL